MLVAVDRHGVQGQGAGAERPQHAGRVLVGEQPEDDVERPDGGHATNYQDTVAAMEFMLHEAGATEPNP